MSSSTLVPGPNTSTLVPATLFRLAAIAGAGSAVILMVNTAKRAELIPTTALTQLVAPLAQILALALVTGLYFAAGSRAGRAGLISFLVNAVALAALVGVEFVINLVFAERAARDHRRPPGRTAGHRPDSRIGAVPGRQPRVRRLAAGHPRGADVPLVLYAVGAIPIALRAFVPEAALLLVLVVLAVAVAWLSAWLFARSSRTHLAG